jgi:hypothetical protein
VGKRLWHGRPDEGTIDELIPLLRAGDRDEVLAADGDLERGCFSALHLSDFKTLGVMRDKRGELVAVYGAAPVSLLASDQAAPWLLGTELMRVNGFSVFHDMKLYLAFLSEHYQRLFNYVDARNVESVGWLSRLGFTIGDPEPRGPHKLPFHPFYMDFS